MIMSTFQVNAEIKNKDKKKHIKNIFYVQG